MAKKIGKDVREVVKDITHWESICSPENKKLLSMLTEIDQVPPYIDI